MFPRRTVPSLVFMQVDGGGGNRTRARFPRQESGPGTREGYVYFLREWCNDESPIKIGFSGDVTERIRQLRYTTGLELELLAWFPATLNVERDLHRRFAATRVRGEWFAPTKELLDAIGLVRVLHNEVAA